MTRNRREAEDENISSGGGGSFGGSFERLRRWRQGSGGERNGNGNGGNELEFGTCDDRNACIVGGVDHDGDNGCDPDDHRVAEGDARPRRPATVRSTGTAGEVQRQNHRAKGNRDATGGHDHQTGTCRRVAVFGKCRPHRLREPTRCPVSRWSHYWRRRARSSKILVSKSRRRRSSTRPGVDGLVLRQQPPAGTPNAGEVVVDVARRPEVRFLSQFKPIDGYASNIGSEARKGNARVYNRWIVFDQDYATTRISFDLSRGYRSLKADLVFDDSADAGARSKVEFFGDDRLLGESEATFGATFPLDLDVTGVLRLRIEVTSLAGGRDSNLYIRGSAAPRYRRRSPDHHREIADLPFVPRGRRPCGTTDLRIKYAWTCIGTASIGSGVASAGTTAASPRVV